MRPQRRIRPGVIAGVATLLGIFSGLQAINYVTLFGDKHPPTGALLSLNLAYWYGWALLMPAMLHVAQRYRFGRRTWKSAVAVHIVASLTFVFLHVLLEATARTVVVAAWWTSPPPSGPWQAWLADVQRLFFLNNDWEMMMYWAVVGTSHAIDYYRESQERALAAAQLETRLAEAQLQALQSQLHPHFLFNTLHAISALMHRDVEQADAMIARLSDLLRLTLDRLGLQELTLREELDFLQKYLQIEQTRFQERLTVQFEIDPETLDARVPNLLLQPLVENAIRHGIAPRVAGGRLLIAAARDGDLLRLEVCDNGPGLSEAALSAFNAGGVGLANTRSRLEHLYGSAHRFEFREPEGGGLLVHIAIPFSLESAAPRRAAMEIVA